MMQKKSTKLVIFFGALAVFMAWGAISLTSAQADSRPDMVVAVPKNPVTMEPMDNNSNVHMRILWNVGETLLRIDYKHNQKLIPWLATEWKRLDGSTLELKLRKGVKFHNGEEFTAEDVAFSFGPQRLFDEKIGLFAKMYLGNIEVPEVVDRYTVRIRSKTPDFLLEKRLANYMSEIVSKKAFLAAKDYATWSRTPVLTGPYKIVELKTAVLIKLAAFDGYWGKKAPAKTITFKVVPEVAGRVAGLKTGEYQIITELPPDQMPSIDKNKGTSAVGGPIGNIRSVNFDNTNSVLKSPELRRAMAMAIDRQLIVDTLFHGFTSVPNGFQMNLFGDMYIKDYPGVSYNPAKARKLVKKSGYKGETIYYRLLSNYYTLQVAQAQILVEMWKAVGLNVKIDMKENWNQILENDETRHIMDLSHTAFYLDPVGMTWRRLAPNWWGRKANKYNGIEPMLVLPEEFDKLGKILETSTDLQLRRKTIRRMMEICDFEDPALISMYAMPMFYGKRDEINWTVYPAEYMDLTATNLSFK